jgi:hypothetical protein
MLADLSGKFVQLVIQLGEPKPTINYLWYTEWADGQYRLQVTGRTAQSNGVKFRPRGISDIAEATNVMAAMKAEYGDHSVQPVHVPAPRSTDQCRYELRRSHNIRLLNSGKRWRIDCVWPRLL